MGRALEGLEGVKRFETDMERLTITVWLEDGADWAAVSEALFQAGIRTTLVGSK